MMALSGGSLMRNPDTHKQALRAALQVARGNRKHTTAAVTGLIMLGGCGDSGPSASSEGSETPSADAATSAESTVDTLVDALDEAAEDALSAEVSAQDIAVNEADPGPALPDDDDTSTQAASDTLVNDVQESEDTESTVDSTTADDTSSASDAAQTPDSGAEGDSSEATDATEPECIDSCWQPNDVSCNEHMDCAIPEDIVGECAISKAPCVYAFECAEEGDSCEGGKPSVFPEIDPETGDIYPFSSGVACFDGMCHEGAQISAAAQACCGFGGGDEALPWCDDAPTLPGGCTPWGPPAPPVHDGMTLAERMTRWLR